MTQFEVHVIEVDDFGYSSSYLVQVFCDGVKFTNSWCWLSKRQITSRISKFCKLNAITDYKVTWK